jgi:DNA polymerase III epsilon subunit-like protein
MSSNPQFCLCIDWETSGAIWGGDSSTEYQGLSFGAIVFDTETFEPIEELYREIKFDASKWKWSDEAERIHGLSREYLEQNGVSAEEAAEDLVMLLSKYFVGGHKLMLMGHNAEFDRRFTNQLLNEVEFEFSVERKQPDYTWIALHHVLLDTSPLGFITLGLYRSNDLFEAIGYEKRGDHNSLDDARQTLGTARAIRQLVQVALQ